MTDETFGSLVIWIVVLTIVLFVGGVILILSGC